MISKPIDAIKINDLAALCEQRVPEGRTLEYKAQLNLSSDNDKKEYLADITSFANSSGGDIVYGIEEDAGHAKKLTYLSIENKDQFLLKLENILRDGIEPRLMGIRLQLIPCDKAGDYCLVCRIPGSLSAPHRITFAKSCRFYARNSSGKYEMDTHELRTAFIVSEQLPARIRDLHKLDIEHAKGKDMPFELEPVASVVVSVIPLGYFRENRQLDITEDNSVSCYRMGRRPDRLVVLEGEMKYGMNTQGQTIPTYCLTHRTGRVEAAWSIGRMEEAAAKQAVAFPGEF